MTSVSIVRVRSPSSAGSTWPDWFIHGSSRWAEGKLFSVASTLPPRVSYRIGTRRSLRRSSYLNGSPWSACPLSRLKMVVFLFVLHAASQLPFFMCHQVRLIAYYRFNFSFSRIHSNLSCLLHRATPGPAKPLRISDPRLPYLIRYTSCNYPIAGIRGFEEVEVKNEYLARKRRICRGLK